MAHQPIEVVDTAGLTDADWAEINRLGRIYEEKGEAALADAMAKLGAKDPVRYMRVMGAFFPDMVREAIKDQMAASGMTEEDLHALIRKLESPARDQ